MVGLSAGPIDVGAVRRSVDDPRMGAVLVFEGVARDTFGGVPVLRLEYEAYPEMALAAMQAIVDEIGERFPAARAAIVHRVGVVPVTEASVVIVVATPHRAECYDASRFAIEALKSRVPIWKKEITADGGTWKANAPAGDP
jgi:molybdopterin synthase catalytic subunit